MQNRTNRFVMPRDILRFLFILAALVVASVDASSQVIANEGFDYSVGSFSGHNGGMGWGAGWQTSTGTTTPGKSFSNLQTLGRSGNIQALGFVSTASASRSLATPNRRRRAGVVDQFLGSRSHGERVADVSQGEAGIVGDRLDRRIHVVHTCRPKMANAFFKMSRSRSTRSNSASNCRTCSSSVPATGPL